eukprot:6181070-Pleurochrysis_carterae.AAC.5
MSAGCEPNISHPSPLRPMARSETEAVARLTARAQEEDAERPGGGPCRMDQQPMSPRKMLLESDCAPSERAFMLAEHVEVRPPLELCIELKFEFWALLFGLRRTVSSHARWGSETCVQFVEKVIIVLVRMRLIRQVKIESKGPGCAVTAYQGDARSRLDTRWVCPSLDRPVELPAFLLHEWRVGMFGRTVRLLAECV